ncbi:hypothetical protein [Clostridium perfringens]|uniref:Uncharacterized protein n=1 Tax=Clostridium perfringens D str. JGS1721 TaxID=488537 RepID=B1V318_CLOPF|nr:hypothetical protein [Clostridium perfringens]EDT71766.1 hypothetical protein CJD_A0451 [Clostridium perfringens D str. JGS1721]ELC8371325.1 hypothetical protein [Clostridium perfringens]MCX0358511.1 hypothetical protein [Clostridium perfringens]MCX0386584.1 hypothetical protein [Clostridium perfringens]MCX0407563.1 hypothetical protein [Clostridium perfringens]
MENFIMFAIGIYMFNIDHWVFRFVRTGLYGLITIDLIRNLKAFNLENVLLIFTGVIMLNSPKIIKFYFRRKFYYR